MTRVFLTTIAFLLVVIPQTAAQEKESVLVGISTSTCARMFEILEADPRFGDALYRGWLDGFLSGFNLALSLEVGDDAAVNLNNSSFPDSDVRFQWLKSSCRTHPERPLWAHATNLFGLLKKTQ